MAMILLSTKEESETPEEPGSEQPPLDTVFAVLQNGRRRMVLGRLREDSEVTLGELAEYIAARENDVPEDSLSTAQRKRVYVALYQSHLPKLDDASAVDFDQNRGTAERTPQTETFLRVLDAVESGMTELDLEGPDAGYGFGSGVLFTGAVLATLLDAVLGGAGVGIGVGVGLMAAGWWTIIYHRTRETTA